MFRLVARTGVSTPGTQRALKEYSGNFFSRTEATILSPQSKLDCFSLTNRVQVSQSNVSQGKPKAEPGHRPGRSGSPCSILYYSPLIPQDRPAREDRLLQHHTSEST